MKIDHKEGRLPFDLITTPFTNNMDDVDQSNLTLHPERPYISGSYKEAQLKFNVISKNLTKFKPFISKFNVMNGK